MSRKTVEKYKAVKQKNKTPVITPAEHRANCEVVADMIMSVFDRLPDNPQPVKESFGELLDQLNSGVNRRETIVNSDGRRIRVDDSGKISVIQKPIQVSSVNTGIKSGGDTGNDKSVFSKDEQAILDKISNG